MSSENGNTRGKPTGTVARVVIVLLLAAGVGAAIYLKETRRPPLLGPAPAPSENTPLPRLLDIGSDTCIPCKMMAPILVELTEEYKGRLEVEVIDLAEIPEAGRDFDVRIIPTQIFFDASGKELFRHEGFMSKEDILARWKELGVDLSCANSRESPYLVGAGLALPAVGAKILVDKPPTPRSKTRRGRLRRVAPTTCTCLT